MNRHLSSLSLAIIVHVIIMALLFTSYFYIASSQSKKKEECMCVQLSCMPEPKKIKKKKIVPKKIEKKVLEKPQKKEIQKVKEPKKQKTINVKEEKIIEEVSEEEVVEETTEEVVEQVIEKIVEKAVTPSKIEKSPEKKYIDENLDKIIQLLQENLYYPRSARKRGVVGEVIVQFTLLKDASVHDIIIVASEREILSRAAQRTIENLSGEFPKPKEKMILHIPIMYSLVNN